MDDTAFIRQQTPAHTAGLSVRILDWKPLRKNSLLGFCKVEFPSGLVISDITVLTSPRGPWASPPSKTMVDRNGVVLKDAAGKIRYSRFIECKSKEIRDRWSSAVIEAMRAAHPGVFTDGH
jgi:hypothetical protein